MGEGSHLCLLIVQQLYTGVLVEFSGETEPIGGRGGGRKRKKERGRGSLEAKFSFSIIRGVQSGFS